MGGVSHAARYSLSMSASNSATLSLWAQSQKSPNFSREESWDRVMEERVDPTKKGSHVLDHLVGDDPGADKIHPRQDVRVEPVVPNDHLPRVGILGVAADKDGREGGGTPRLEGSHHPQHPPPAHRLLHLLIILEAREGREGDLNNGEVGYAHVVVDVRASVLRIVGHPDARLSEDGSNQGGEGGGAHVRN